MYLKGHIDVRSFSPVGMIWIINALNSYDNKNTENQQNISVICFFFYFVLVKCVMTYGCGITASLQATFQYVISCTL